MVEPYVKAVGVKQQVVKNLKVIAFFVSLICFQMKPTLEITKQKKTM